jgi:hypothetical protein
MVFGDVCSNGEPHRKQSESASEMIAIATISGHSLRWLFERFELSTVRRDTIGLVSYTGG